MREKRAEPAAESLSGDLDLIHATEAREMRQQTDHFTELIEAQDRQERRSHIAKIFLVRCSEEIKRAAPTNYYVKLEFPGDNVSYNVLREIVCPCLEIKGYYIPNPPIVVESADGSGTEVTSFGIGW